MPLKDTTCLLEVHTNLHGSRVVQYGNIFNRDRNVESGWKSSWASIWSRQVWNSDEEKRTAVKFSLPYLGMPKNETNWPVGRCEPTDA